MEALWIRACGCENPLRLEIRLNDCNFEEINRIFYFWDPSFNLQEGDFGIIKDSYVQARLIINS